MKKKVLIGYVIAAVVALLAFEYAFWTNGFRYLEHHSERSYLTQTELLKDLFLAEDVAGQSAEQSGGNAFEQFADSYAEKYGIRITVIDKEGNVLGEARGAGELRDNHRERKRCRRPFRETVTAVSGVQILLTWITVIALFRWKAEISRALSVQRFRCRSCRTWMMSL